MNEEEDEKIFSCPIPFLLPNSADDSEKDERTNSKRHPLEEEK